MFLPGPEPLFLIRQPHISNSTPHLPISFWLGAHIHFVQQGKTRARQSPAAKSFHSSFIAQQHMEHRSGAGSSAPPAPVGPKEAEESICGDSCRSQPGLQLPSDAESSAVWFHEHCVWHTQEPGVPSTRDVSTASDGERQQQDQKEEFKEHRSRVVPGAEWALGWCLGQGRTHWTRHILTWLTAEPHPHSKEKDSTSQASCSPSEPEQSTTIHLQWV